MADIGLIGLAVMGQNLVLNMADHGFKVSVYNRTYATTKDFVAEHPHILGFQTLDTFVASLARPRKVMLMVKAGEAVDVLIAQLLPLLEAGDIIIDGGNSHYADSSRRCDMLEAKGILFVGTGISGGEEGARHGPSMMPGGNVLAWEAIKPIFQSICAKVSGEACCDWVGSGGAGHYVKMVHNGIEYGDMQLISEAYQLLRYALHLDPDAMAEIFTQWSAGVLDSYLIEITADILRFKDTDGTPLIDKIVDAALQKGTGKWTAINALDLGVPLSLISEAVFARFLSALASQRKHAALRYKKPLLHVTSDNTTIQAVESALYASKIISYAQGYMLMQEADRQYGWKLNYGGIALMWRGGCIIRSRFLDAIRNAYRNNPDLSNLLLDDFFHQALTNAQQKWRDALKLGIDNAVALPAMSAALAFFDGYCSARGGAELIQAQRDYFGAHTYERIDAPAGKHFHTKWHS